MAGQSEPMVGASLIDWTLPIAALLGIVGVVVPPPARGAAPPPAAGSDLGWLGAIEVGFAPIGFASIEGSDGYGAQTKGDPSWEVGVAAHRHLAGGLELGGAISYRAFLDDDGDNRISLISLTLGPRWRVTEPSAVELLLGVRLGVGFGFETEDPEDTFVAVRVDGSVDVRFWLDDDSALTLGIRPWWAFGTAFSPEEYIDGRPALALQPFDIVLTFTQRL